MWSLQPGIQIRLGLGAAPITVVTGELAFLVKI